MQITVRLAETPEDFQKIYRLRYEIYVREMGRPQSYADHDKELIQEPYDETGRLYLAETSDGLIIGTMRCNLRKDGPLEAEELYNLDLFTPFYPDQISMTTKLMVKKEFRNTSAAAMLAVHGYIDFRESGIKLDFIDANPHLVRLYQQMGYRLYKENINHKDYGNVIPMVFLLDDIEYMMEINSPFRRYAKRYQNTDEAAKFFQENFPEYARVRPLFSIDSEKLWDAFSNDLNKPPQEVLQILKGFSPEESSKVLSQLDLIQYDSGDVVFQEGEESSGMFCILDGQAEVFINQDGKEIPVAILTQGETFGEQGFLTAIKRNAGIRLRDKSRILVLTQSEFKKLENSYPKLANKLLINLFGILVKRFNENSRSLWDLQKIMDTVIQRHSQPEALYHEKDKTSNDDQNDSDTKESTAATKSVSGSYKVDEYADSTGEILRLKAQAKGGFALEKPVFDRTGMDKAHRILDAGCGPGFVALEVARAYQPEVLHGVDIDPKLIEIADEQLSIMTDEEKQGLENIELEFKTGSVYSLPCSDADYNMVYSRFVLQHLDDPMKALTELKRVVKPGGRVLIEDIDDGMLFLDPEPGGYRAVQDTAEKLQSEWGGDRRIGRKLHRYLRESGFEDIRILQLPVTSKKLGMEAFIGLAYGFKFDHLLRSGSSAEEVEAYKNQFFSLVSNPAAFGSLVVYFAHGRRPV